MRDHRICKRYCIVVGLIFSLIVSALISPALTARASVTLLYFTASPLSSTIEVKWETATELNTIGFNVYRSDSENPASWGSPVFNTGSRSLDGTTGALYTFEDGKDGNVGNVQPNVRYYYLLEEISTSGNTRFTNRVTSAGIGLPTSTATISPTPSRTITPIAVDPTRTRTATAPPLPTVPPAPTATRQFANTATPIPTATMTPFTGSAFNSALPTPFRIPTDTPLTSFQLTSPTPMGGIPLQQPAPVFGPTTTMTPTPALVALAPTATPTFLTAQLEPSASPTALLRAQQNITRTPQVFEPSAANRRATPAATASARSSRLAFTLGGGAVLLAVLLGIGGFAFWQRRH